MDYEPAEKFLEFILDQGKLTPEQSQKFDNLHQSLRCKISHQKATIILEEMKQETARICGEVGDGKVEALWMMCEVTRWLREFFVKAVDELVKAGKITKAQVEKETDIRIIEPGEPDKPVKVDHLEILKQLEELTKEELLDIAEKATEEAKFR